MRKIDISETLRKLESLKLNDLSKELNKYSVKTLELLGASYYHETFNKKFSKLNNPINTLEFILSRRMRKLNKKIIWTKENKDKFLSVNNKLLTVSESAYKEAVLIAEGLEYRIANNDNFLKDYEIEIEINTYMNDVFYKNDNYIGWILSEPLSNIPVISFTLSHSHYNEQIKEIPFFLDKNINWNFEYFNKEFQDEYICSAIHSLIETHWSFLDIININKIWADVKVYYQHYYDL